MYDTQSHRYPTAVWQRRFYFRIFDRARLYENNNDTGGCV